MTEVEIHAPHALAHEPAKEPAPARPKTPGFGVLVAICAAGVALIVTMMVIAFTTGPFR